MLNPQQKVLLPELPFAIAYHQPTNSMLIAGQSNGVTGIYLVQGRRHGIALRQLARRDAGPRHEHDDGAVCSARTWPPGRKPACFAGFFRPGKTANGHLGPSLAILKLVIALVVAGGMAVLAMLPKAGLFYEFLPTGPTWPPGHLGYVGSFF